jgi:hypothetical protein
LSPLFALILTVQQLEDAVVTVVRSGEEIWRLKLAAVEQDTSQPVPTTSLSLELLRPMSLTYPNYEEFAPLYESPSGGSTAAHKQGDC